MTAPVQSLTRALMFAAQKHTDQRRMGAPDAFGGGSPSGAATVNLRMLRYGALSGPREL